ncbi:SNF2 domain-containing protein CLASSY 4-like [Nymphaea colorata]|nr:SNF2 domain-containing protein CLASSY 4-like [Nymphaea colorata]
MSCVARRTRRQTQKSSGSRPPAAIGSSERRRRVARRNGGKSETVVLSSKEDGNDKKGKEEGEVVEGEEGQHSGFVGRSLGRKKNLGSAKKRRRIARKNGGKSETVILSSEEDDNDKEEEVDEAEGEGARGHPRSFVRRNVGRKWNLKSGKGREEASARGSCWEGAAGSISVREGVPSCCRRKRDGIHVTGDHDGCKEEFVGKGISRRTQVETKSSVDGEFHWSNEFVWAKRNAPVRKTRQWGRLTKGNSAMNQEKKKNNLSGRQIKVDEEDSVAEFEEGSNGKDNSNHDESSNNEFEKDEREEESHGESDDDEFEVGESKEETDDDDESIHYGSDGVNFTNEDRNHLGTSARREIAVEEEMRISSDANMGQEDEKDGVDDHAVDNDEGEEKYEGIAAEEIRREKRQVLQRENPIIQKKEIKNRMEREKPGRNSKQETSVAIECRVNERTKDSSRCPFSVSNNGAQDDVGDHFKKMGASNAEAQLAEDCTDDPSDATDENKWGLLNNCVARRTRSNFKQTPIGKFGSFSKPICIGMNNSLNPLVVDHDMHHDGSSSGHQVSDNGVPDYDGNDNVADEKGLANDFSDVSSHRINGDLDSDDDGNDCLADRKCIGTGFADNVMETADIKISGKKGTCFGDFLGDAGRVTDGSAEKGIRKMGREASREQQCDYIDDDCSSCCDDSEDDEDEESESDGCSDMEINEYPEGNSGNAKTKHGSLDVSLFDLLVATISRKRVAIPNDVKSSEGENLTKELPLWFSFRDLQPEHVKSETEENLDALWAELDFVLECEAIGSFDWQEIEVEPKGSMFSCEFKSPACQHQFVLDEQVGVICRICSFVKTEIKHFMPPMVSGTFGKQSRKGSYEEGDDSVLGEFDCEASGCSNISNDFTSGTVWDIIPELRKKMFQHQKEGFEFIWKNLAGGIVLDQLTSNSDAVGGCLISHAPGSGKTFLTIAFLQSFLQRFDDCRSMIVAPVNLLHIWEGEFIKWGIGVPLHMLNSRGFSGRESSSALELLTRRRGKLGSTGRQNLCRIIKIFSWIDRKSVLLISYGLFRKLTTERRHSDKEGQVIRKILLEYPGLLVLDEGHTARNRFSRIWQCLKRVKTQRRIMLSGTPFQNNFVELFNTLYLIRPTFAEGIFKSFGDHENGLEADPVEKEMSLQDKNETVFRRTFATFSGGIEPRGNSSRLKELRLIIDPFVHVHEGNLHKLPGLRDYFVFLYPSTLQRCILEKLTEKSNFENNYRVSCISVHPSILLGIETLDAKDRDVIKEHQADLSNARITDGVKVRFVVELVRLCAALNEKVLVFSQFVLPLSNIKHFLISSFNWTTGQEVLQLDGGIAQKCRQPIIHTFNNSQKVKVLLVSTEVCAEGMDLTGASRVVLLDLAWNPSVRRQAIGRAYRIGQKKVVYAYNLIASSTLEEKKHKIQDIKDKFSQLVFSTVAKNDTLVDTLKECDDGVLCELIKRDISASFFEKVLEPKCG